MKVELNKRSKILLGVVVLVGALAAAWFLFLEEMLNPPPPPVAKAPKPAAAAAAPKPAAAEPAHVGHSMAFFRVDSSSTFVIGTNGLAEAVEMGPILADRAQALSREPAREDVLVDHVEEHTVGYVLDEGYWAGMTLYPTSKCTPARAADIVEKYGPERLLVNSAGDWGPSRPTAVPDFIFEMRARGHSEATIRRVVLENPLAFFGRCKRFVAPARLDA